MGTKYYRDADGHYLGSTAVHDGADDDAEYPPAPDGGIEVPSAPFDARAMWNGSAWDHPVDPDPTGFSQAIKNAMGGVVAANALARQYPLFYPAIQEARWDDLTALIEDAHDGNILNGTQYAAIKALASEFHIPITLP